MGGECDLLRIFFRGAFEQWVPDADRVFPRRQVLQECVSCVARDLEVWGWQHSDVSNHPVVDVASKRNESNVVE